MMMTQQIFWKQVECYKAILAISLPAYPPGGLNQTTPESPLSTQLAFTKARQALCDVHLLPQSSSLSTASLLLGAELVFVDTFQRCFVSDLHALPL